MAVVEIAIAFVSLVQRVTVIRSQELDGFLYAHWNRNVDEVPLNIG